MVEYMRNMKEVRRMVLNLLKMSIKESSVLGTKKYGTKVSAKKPESQSILGARTYGSTFQRSSVVKNAKDKKDFNSSK